jgi:CO dehydrogenase/acetyl-CoA synthase alpha subunit
MTLQIVPSLHDSAEHALHDFAEHALHDTAVQSQGLRNQQLAQISRPCDISRL